MAVIPESWGFPFLAAAAVTNAYNYVQKSPLCSGLRCLSPGVRPCCFEWGWSATKISAPGHLALRWLSQLFELDSSPHSSMASGYSPAALGRKNNRARVRGRGDWFQIALSVKCLFTGLKTYKRKLSAHTGVMDKTTISAFCYWDMVDSVRESAALKWALSFPLHPLAQELAVANWWCQPQDVEQLEKVSTAASPLVNYDWWANPPKEPSAG